MHDKTIIKASRPLLVRREHIEHVVSFIPALESIPPDAIARWSDPEELEDGSLAVNVDPDYHPTVLALKRSFHENNFVQPFDWGQWQPEASKFVSEPHRLSQASLETCTKLITLHIRKDRFCSGHFGEMVRCGHVVAILRRLEALRGMMSE